MSYMSVIMVFVMLFSHSHGDFLDMTTTDAYWKAKNVQVTQEMLLAEVNATPQTTKKVDLNQAITDLQSDNFEVRSKAKVAIRNAGDSAREALEKVKDSTDPEVADYARRVLSTLGDHAQEQSVRKLMAIRTLGERKTAAALPALKALLDSKEIFVADYAAKAIANIEGKKLPRVVDLKASDADVALLPADTGIVAQMGNGPGMEYTLSKLITTLSADTLKAYGTTAENMEILMTKQLLAGIEQAGNVRLDALTVGISADLGPGSGWVAVIGRGKFNPATAEAFFQQVMFRGGTNPIVPVKQKDLTILSQNDATIVIKGNDHILVIIGRSDSTAVAKEHIIEAFNNPNQPDGLLTNPDMVAALKKVDHQKTIWAVATQISPDIKREPFFAGFDSATATGNAENDVFKWSAEGHGSDPALIAQSIDSMNQNITQTLQQFQNMPAPMSARILPLLDMLKSIKATSKDNTATLTGEIKFSAIPNLAGIYQMARRSATTTVHTTNATTTRP